MGRHIILAFERGAIIQRGCRRLLHMYGLQRYISMPTYHLPVSSPSVSLFSHQNGPNQYLFYFQFSFLSPRPHSYFFLSLLFLLLPSFLMGLTDLAHLPGQGCQRIRSDSALPPQKNVGFEAERIMIKCGLECKLNRTTEKERTRIENVEKNIESHM